MEGDMLVLTRKTGEGIIIGDDIRITVVEIKGGGIRLGIEAPPEKKIYRQEVFDRICQENKEAMLWDLADLNALSESLTTKKEQK
jgi:carbon storage regulator